MSKIIEIKSEDERRMHQRRAADRALNEPKRAERRRYALLNAAVKLYKFAAKNEKRDELNPTVWATINIAEALLKEIESRERIEGE